jgi:hypothetical protein
MIPLPTRAPMPSTYTPDSDRTRGAPGQATAAAALYADVAGRLRRVCAATPPGEFDRLVLDICAVKLRWAADAHLGRQMGHGAL